MLVLHPRLLFRKSIPEVPQISRLARGHNLGLGLGKVLHENGRVGGPPVHGLGTLFCEFRYRQVLVLISGKNLSFSAVVAILF